MNKEYIHIKTGKIYKVINMNIINATNKDDGDRMVLYEGMKRDKSGMGVFVREYNEFINKFIPYKKINE